MKPKSPDKTGSAGSTSLKVLRATAEITANGMNAVTRAVARNDQAIANGTQKATHATGAVLDATGEGLAKGGFATAKAAFSGSKAAGQMVSRAVAGDSNSLFRKGMGGLFGIAANLALKASGASAAVIGVAGVGIAAAGRGVQKMASAVGGATGGAAKGIASSAGHTVDAALLPAASIEKMRDELRAMGKQMQFVSAGDLKRARRDQLLDSVVVGGITLSQLLRDPSSVPPQVQQAFELAYPGLHMSGESFADAASRMSNDELVGLISGVKGKLFELQLIEQLNDGQLPRGWEAHLAGSATQTGWDIQILDENGNVQEVLQAKATESADYVAQALEQYPGIDVTTTTEVHAQLTALSLAEGVRNSGISEATLEAAVTSAAASNGDVLTAADLLPSTLGLAVVSMSVFLRKDLDLREKGAAIGERSARVGVFGYVGQATMIATQAWWLALVAGVGTSWLAARGGNKRDQYQLLRAAVATMGNVERRRRRLLSGEPPRLTRA